MHESSDFMNLSATTVTLLLLLVPGLALLILIGLSYAFSNWS